MILLIEQFNIYFFFIKVFVFCYVDNNLRMKGVYKNTKPYIYIKLIRYKCNESFEQPSTSLQTITSLNWSQLAKKDLLSKNSNGVDEWIKSDKTEVDVKTCQVGWGRVDQSLRGVQRLGPNHCNRHTY